MSIYAEKICDMHTLLKYAKKCRNERNMRQSHIRIKLTCLATEQFFQVQTLGQNSSTFGGSLCNKTSWIHSALLIQYTGL